MTTENAPSIPRPRSIWPWWVLLALAAALGGAIGSGWVARSLVLDLIAGWPLLALLMLVGVVQAFRSRSVALPAMVMTSYLVLMAAFFAAGVPLLPSRAADVSVVVGPEVADAELKIELDSALLVIESMDGAGYRIATSLLGGSVGAPQVVESVGVDGLSLVAVARDGDDWFRSGGWRIGLGEATEWSLELSGDGLEIDLRMDGAVHLTGSGVLDLGVSASSLVIDGDFVVTVPAGSNGVVVGSAATPPGWVTVESLDEVPEGQTVIEVVSGEVQVVFAG